MTEALRVSSIATQGEKIRFLVIMEELKNTDETGLGHRRIAGEFVLRLLSENHVINNHLRR